MTQYVMSALEQSPIIVERLIGKLDSAALDTPASQGRFTPREVVAHLADWEPVLHARIKQSVESPGSTIKTYDDDRENEKAYATADPLESARSFMSRRQETVAYLKSLDKADWAKSAIHPSRGPISVQEWAATIVGHDMYHLEQLTSAWKT